MIRYKQGCFQYKVVITNGRFDFFFFFYFMSVYCDWSESHLFHLLPIVIELKVEILTFSLLLLDRRQVFDLPSNVIRWKSDLFLNFSGWKKEKLSPFYPLCLDGIENLWFFHLVVNRRCLWISHMDEMATGSHTLYELMYHTFRTFRDLYLLSHTFLKPFSTPQVLLFSLRVFVGANMQNKSSNNQRRTGDMTVSKNKRYRRVSLLLIATE